MTRGTRSTLAVLAALLLSLIVAPARATKLTLIHVNDTHSYLEASGPKDRHLRGTIGGLAKAATVIQGMKASEPNALFVHAGDLFQGDIYFNATMGVVEWQLLMSLGLDVAAIGNHEFHLGPDALASALSAAFPTGDAPFVSANLDLSAYPALGTFIQPSRIKTVGGLKVGFFGLTTPFDFAALPEPVQILGSDVVGLFTIAGNEVEHLRAQGVDVVVCVSHLGIQLDRLLAQNVPGIDAIIGGHDHLVLAQPELVTSPTGYAVPIVQAGAHYEYVGKLSLSVDAGKVTVASYELVHVDGHVARSAVVSSAVEQLQTSLTAQYGDLFYTPIAVALRDVTTSTDDSRPARDTGMGNLITDSLRCKTGTDIALTVNGLIPAGLPRGVIVPDDVFRTVANGFNPQTGLGFRLFTLRISGAELLRALETTLEAVEQGDGDLFVQASGLTYSYDPRRAFGERVVAASIGGRALDPARTYTATVDEGVVAGLPQLGIVVTDVSATGDDEFLTLRDYVSRLHMLLYGSMGRIRDVSAH